MPGYIDEADVEKVRDSVNIAEVISGYVNLKRKGQGDFWGRCPFHQEKTASFHVRPDRGMFHCFGCGKGGNVFTFLMEIEGVSFSEAVKMLAERVGIELKTTVDSKSAAKVRNHKDMLFQATAMAESRFHNNLISKNRSKDALTAYKYLTDRGLTPEMIRMYKLGWAESGWDSFTKFAERKGIKGSILAEVGLASQRKDKSGFVDRFRARIIFPIQNLSGKAIAFGARRLEKITPEDDTAKYINSPESVVYRKGSNLYGLFTARESIRKTGHAWLVEGYTDLLALVQAGLVNTVASLGTALTIDQAKLVNRFTSKVVVVYDSDEAGQSAARRSADVLTQAGLDARMVILPDGEDPDSLLRSGGSELLIETLNRDLSFVEFYLTTVLKKQDMNSLQEAGNAEKLTAARSLMETIQNIPSAGQRDLLKAELAQTIGIQPHALERELSRYTRFSEQDDAVSSQRLNIPPEAVPERDLLKALLGQPKLIGETLPELSPEMFSHEPLKSLYKTLEKATLKGERIEMSSLPERFNDPKIRSFIAEAILPGYDETIDDARNTINVALKLIRLRELKKQFSELERKIQIASRNGELPKEAILESIELKRRMTELNE